MSAFVRRSSSPSDKYGAISYYVDDNGFIRRSKGPSDKYGAIVYYYDDNGFVRQSNGPSDKCGQIVYYVDGDGFVRKSNGPSDKYGAIVYYCDDSGFIRRSNGPSDKYGQIVFYLEKERKQEGQQSVDDKRGMLLAIAFVIGLIFAPILIVLGMFGKFLLGGLFKNVLPLDAFKKFRKIYSIINLAWLGVGITAIVLLAIFEIDVTIALYSLVGGNVLLFILSIVFGNKIYNEHKHELPQVEETFETSTIVEEVGNDEFAEDVSASTVISQEEPTSTDSTSVDAMTRELASYKRMLDGGLISQDEYNALKNNLFRKMGVSNSTSPTVSLVFLWICNILNFLGIFINMMIAIGVNGYLHSMYEYILGGYIGGFSVIATCTPAIIAISLAIKEKAKTNSAVKNAITGGVVSIALTTLLMILSIFL